MDAARVLPDPPLTVNEDVDLAVLAIALSVALPPEIVNVSSTFRLTTLVTTWPYAVVAVTVTLADMFAAVELTIETTPDVETVTPLYAETVHVIVDVVAPAVTVEVLAVVLPLYVRISAPPESVSAGSDLIVMTLVVVCVGPFADVPVMVIAVDLTTAEDPLMTPVEALRLNPAGMLPDVTAHVTPRSDPVCVIAVDETVVLYEDMV